MEGSNGAGNAHGDGRRELTAAGRAARRLRGVRADFLEQAEEPGGVESRFAREAAKVAKELLDAEIDTARGDKSSNAGDYENNKEEDTLLGNKRPRRSYSEDLGEEKYDGDDALLRQQHEDGAKIALTGFHLDEENEMGRFDGEGGFSWRRKTDEVADAWVDSIKEAGELAGDQDENDIDRVTKQKAQRAKDDLQRAPVRHKTPEIAVKSRQFYLQSLVDLLQEDDTVLLALARYGKVEKRKVEDLTEAANRLVIDMPEIYEKTRRQLDMEVRGEREKRMKQTLWEYKLSLEPGAPVYGPYSSQEMQGWRNRGYFGGKQQAFLRRITKKPSAAAGSGNSVRNEPDAKKSKMELKNELAADFDDDDDNEEDNIGNGTDAEAGVDDNDWRPSSEVIFTDVFS